MSFDEAHGERRGDVGNHELAGDLVLARGQPREISQLAQVGAPMAADKGKLERSHAGVLEVSQFAAVAHQGDHAREN